METPSQPDQPQLTASQMLAHIQDRRRRVIRTNGEVTELPHPINMQHARALIRADATDTVNLRHLRPPLMVMILNDRGYEVESVERGTDAHGFSHTELVPQRALLPVNLIATALYHANCIPGTTHQIVGDVVIVPDSDFES